MGDKDRDEKEQRVVSKAQCKYCGRTFKSPRGRSIHERACKRKEAEGAPDDESIEAIQEDEFTTPSPIPEEELLTSSESGRKGGLKVDFRMPDTGYGSDQSLEIRQLVGQMEDERRRWEQERRKFLEQTESLVVDGKQLSGEMPQERPSARSIDEQDATIAETRYSEEIRQIKEELSRTASPDTLKELSESRDEIEKQLSDLDENVATLTTVLSEFSARTLHDIDSLGKKIDGKADLGELKAFRKTLEKMDGRLDEIIEEVGFEEALDVSKIPPGILELVYQNILDDIARAMNRTLGDTDTEEIIQRAMEEVRVRTSGSELFRYKASRFIVEGLAVSIEKGLISAKQVQMTYEELVRRLKEHIPHHQTKSFRSMTKVKSQEFAVDRSRIMAKELMRAQENIKTLEKSVAEVSKQMSDDVSRITAELDELAGRLEAISVVEPVKPTSKTPGVIVLDDSDEPETRVPQEDLEKEVLGIISQEGTSFTKLKKTIESSVPDEDIQLVLDSLVERKAIDKKKRGKGYVYSSCEIEEESRGESENEQ